MACENGDHERSPATAADRPAASDADDARHVELTQDATVSHDAWASLRKFTAARIALGRSGGSLPTAELLKFELDHAAARDAVNSELDFARLKQDLASLGLAAITLRTEAGDRQTYFQRPDLGRRLSSESRLHLEQLHPSDDCDVSIIVADGLSALAVQLHAPTVLAALVPGLRSNKHGIAPITLVRFGRVAVMDEIGAAHKSRVAVILIGERPGLGAADSLGAYLVFAPSRGKTDADRNCVSNIRPAGLKPADAAQTILYLIQQILQKQLSGIAVKDERVYQPRLS
jgi:ethanolamine ammonia-lyase small subunit